MSHIVVYTCILDHWDYLRAPRPSALKDSKARFVCYTDRAGPHVEPWEFAPAFTPLAQAGRNARLVKILPHLHFQADYSIYHDGNFELRQTPEYLIDRYLGANDVAMFKHPCRTNVGQEGDVCINEKIGDAGEVAAQIAEWKRRGSPDGLWCGGLIIRRHTDAVAAFNETWWLEFAAGCTRDQLALPMAKALSPIALTTIEGDVFNNHLIAHNYHSAWVDKGDNPREALRVKPYQERRRRLENLLGLLG